MPITLKSTGGGSVSIDVPSTGATFTLTAPANNATIFTTDGGAITGNVAFTSNNISIGGQTISPAVGMKNRIINGDMRIDQRSNGSSVTASTTSFPWPYTVDRWNYTASQASKFTVQQNAGSVTPPAGFTDYLGVTSSSAYTVGVNENFCIQQRIEGYNIADLSWGTANAKTVTVSFWVRSSLTGTFSFNFDNGSDNRTYVAPYTINSANTWEYKTITIPGDTTGTWFTTNGVGVCVTFSLGTGTNLSTSSGTWNSGLYLGYTGQVNLVGTSGATFYITGVQFEVGSVATPFERRLYGQELALCQRYFEMSYDIGTVPATATATGSITAFPAAYTTYFPISFKVNKRAIPTMTGYSPFNGATGNMSVNLVSNQALAGFISAGTFGACAYASYVANVSAYLHFIASAEL